MEKWRYKKVKLLNMWGMSCLLLRSPNAGNSYNVRYVDRDGDYNNCNAYNGMLGVRPASVINST